MFHSAVTVQFAAGVVTKPGLTKLPVISNVEHHWPDQPEEKWSFLLKQKTHHSVTFCLAA